MMIPTPIATVTAIAMPSNSKLCLPYEANHTKGWVKGQLEINPSSQCGQAATLGGWAGGVQNYRLLGNSASVAKTAKSWTMNSFYTHEQHKK